MAWTEPGLKDLPSLFFADMRKPMKDLGQGADMIKNSFQEEGAVWRMGPGVGRGVQEVVEAKSMSEITQKGVE